MTHGSLFSGLGGFDLAARWMDWRNAFNCEIDGFCSRVLGYHFPESEHYGDIRTTDFTKWRGRIDVLSGGFPCQPFSVAGRRRGAEDDRYLWPEMLRAVREIRPSWIVGENVAGILTMVQPGEETKVASETSLFGESYEETEVRQRHVVETVCEDLEREGYSVQPLVIPACAVGAPHRRDRVWFVAHRDDAGTEGQRQEREDGVHAAGSPADAYGFGRSGRRTDAGGRDDNPIVREDLFTADTGSCRERSASYADGERCQHRGDNRGARPLRDELRRDIEEDQPERDGRERGAGEDGAPAPHTESPGVEGECERGQGEVQPHGRDSEDIQSRWRDFPTQSPVCQRYDGISNNVVRYIKQEVYDAIKEYIRREDLSCVRKAFQKKTIREQIGRLYEIPEPNILLEVLQRTSKAGRPEQRQNSLSPFSARASERVLRYLRKYGTFAGSPFGQKYQEQFRGQFNDTLPELSHEIALATKKIVEECESTAAWVRTQSVKAYGNAVVPQVVYEIFRTIEIAEESYRQ